MPEYPLTLVILAIQDISQLPKPHHLKELSQYASDVQDKEFLLRLASADGNV